MPNLPPFPRDVFVLRGQVPEPSIDFIRWIDLLRDFVATTSAQATSVTFGEFAVAGQYAVDAAEPPFAGYAAQDVDLSFGAYPEPISTFTTADYG